LDLHIRSKRRESAGIPAPIPLHLGSAQRAILSQDRQIESRVDVHHDRFVCCIRVKGIIQWECGGIGIERSVNGEEEWAISGLGRVGDGRVSETRQEF
jgi:hypothetical protein